MLVSSELLQLAELLNVLYLDGKVYLGLLLNRLINTFINKGQEGLDNYQMDILGKYKRRPADIHESFWNKLDDVARLVVQQNTLQKGFLQKLESTEKPATVGITVLPYELPATSLLKAGLKCKVNLA